VKTSVLILAAGPAWRGWTEKAPKQLALIAGEPLILRTLRQLKAHGHDANAVVVTHIQAIQVVVPRYFAPAAHRFWHETLTSTRALWEDRTIVLNGDTIYSDEALRAILVNQPGIMFYGQPKGNMTHLDALSFDAAENERIAKAAQRATKAAAQKRGPRINTMWGLYHVLFDLSLRARHAPVGAFRAHPAGDYTCDFDKPESHAQFCAEYKWARNG